MSVKHILSSKGHHVVSIAPDRTLAEVARLLSERKIGAVLVRAGEGPFSGIISERDIVRAISDEGTKALEQPVARFMTAKVATCTSKASIDAVMGVMTEGKFRHLPVVDDGALIGIISIGDVVKYRLAEIEAETQAIRNYIATA